MFLIKDDRQIAALGSPVRLAILDTLDAGGPAPVSDLARILGLRVDGLYYHLRILAKHKLVSMKDDVVRGRKAAIVDLPARPLKIVYRPEQRANTKAVVRAAGAMLRGALRMFTRAFALSPHVSGKRRELWAAQRIGRLTARELEQVNAHLQQVLDILEHSRSDIAKDGRRLYSVAFVLSPFLP
ncbi:MAG TPA: helix-turn-helix domain-containing protein [Thermoanaerobaculia bacterium]|nr:helix-turn-helix domain-containing protein [Thermoanaerobaculia bacterium]